LDLPSDRDGIARPQGPGVDIGAWERPLAIPTPTATPTLAAATATPGAGLGVSGALRARGGAAMVGAALTLAGAATRSAATGAGGAYAFAGVAPGVWQLTPRKSGDLRFAVTALDAAWVLQLAAGLRSLDAVQRLAGDVTGDGSVSALDAALILQRAVGLEGPFPAATACASDWLFLPAPAALPNQSIVSPSTAGGCVMGSVTYGPLATAAGGQDFTGVLLGDVTGNWQ
jgi:hypothetical protein